MDPILDFKAWSIPNAIIIPSRLIRPPSLHPASQLLDRFMERTCIINLVLDSGQLKVPRSATSQPIKSPVENNPHLNLCFNVFRVSQPCSTSRIHARIEGV